MSSPSLRTRRLLPAVIVAGMSALVLTGCQPGALAPSSTPTPSTSATPSAAPTETPEPSAAPTEEPAATEGGETSEPTTPPVAGETACSEVYTAEQLYEFNPNFAPTSERGDLPGSISAIADAGGTVCAYQHVTAEDRLVIGVLPNAGTADGLGFQTVGDVGVATSLEGSALVSVASIYFATAQDAQPIVDQVAANLR